MAWSGIWDSIGTAKFQKGKEPYVWKFYEKLLKDYNFKGKKILEFGCGTGINTTIMGLHGAKITLVDFSKEALKLAKKNLDAMGIDAELIRADIFDFDEKNNYDLVHCLPAGTMISTKNGKVDIIELCNKGQEKILSYDIKKEAIIENRIRTCVKSGHEQVYSIITEAGRKIQATSKHRFFTKNGWKRVDELNVSDNLIVDLKQRESAACGNDIKLKEEDLLGFIDDVLRERKSKLPKSKYRHSSKDYLKVMRLYQGGIKSRERLAELTGIPPGSINNWLVGRNPPQSLKILQELKVNDLFPIINKQKVLILARLMGHIFSDGWVSESGESVRFILGFSEYENVNEIRDDLKSLGFNCGKTYEKKNIRIINGKKIKQNVLEIECSKISFWVLLRFLGSPFGRKSRSNYSVPGWIMKSIPAQREFISAFLGGDGEQPAIKGKSPRPVRINFMKILPLHKSGMCLAKQFEDMLQQFGVSVKRITYTEKSINGKKVLRIEINTSNKLDSILNICEIGYKYCKKKDDRAKIVGEYLRIKKQILDKRNEQKSEAKKLAQTGMGTEKIAQKIGIKKYEVFNWVNYNQEPSTPKSFPTFEKWKKESLTDNIDTTWEKITDISMGDKKDVYDIEMVKKPRNFFANDILVHNSEGVVEHFLPPRRQEIVEIHARAAKKGGKVLIIIPHIKNMPYRIGKKMANKMGCWIYGNEYPYTRNELIVRMKRAGLKPGEVLGGELLFSLFWLFTPIALRSSRMLRKGIVNPARPWWVRMNYANRWANRWGRVIGCVGEKPK